jgi:hypothetical protein
MAGSGGGVATLARQGRPRAALGWDERGSEPSEKLRDKEFRRIASPRRAL